MIYVIISVLTALILLITVKLCLVKKSVREITSFLDNRLSEDTNTRIRISSRDRDVCRLSQVLNTELQTIREEKLQYQQGNAELKNAVTNISHDIRTPLTAIYGYLDMMQKTDDPEKQKRYTAVMMERADMMKHLTEELFRYSVIVSEDEDTSSEEVFVNQLLVESIGSFYPALSEKGIEPVINITDERVIRNVNKDALSRIFSNLLSNAVRYSDGDLEIVLAESGEITFSNTAGNLSKVEVEKLFDRFYTVESARNSTGLGLSIARTLTERIGGTISAEYDDNRLTVRMKI